MFSLMLSVSSFLRSSTLLSSLKMGISKISAQELKEVGRDELTGVNLGQVDPATLQATKIACGAHMCGLVRCNYFRVWKNEWWMNSGTRSATTSVCCGSWGRSQKKVLCYRNWWDAWPTRLHSRQACLLNQGSIQTGIVLNPAGSCAVRHEPYGVLDFRVTIDSLPCDKVAGFGRMFCLKFPFQVYFWSSGEEF